MENVSVGGVTKETEFPARKVYRFSKHTYENPNFSNSMSVATTFSTLTCTSTIRFTGKTADLKGLQKHSNQDAHRLNEPLKLEKAITVYIFDLVYAY